MEEEKKKKVATIAIVSVVCGALSFIPGVGVLFCLPAMVTGLIALMVISKKKETLRGRGIAITGVSLSLLAFVGCLAFVKMLSGPSDAELASFFRNNRDDFETLRVMFLEDKNVKSVGKKKVHLFDVDKPGVSRQRQARYGTLLDKLNLIGLWDWKVDEDNNKTAIAFFAHRGGWAAGGDARFYLWFDYTPTPRDAERMKGIIVVSFTPLDGNWYLLHESN